MRWSSMAAVLLAAGCSDGTGPDNRELYGAYFLSSLNGEALPATPEEFPEGYVLLGAHLGFYQVVLPAGLALTSPPEFSEAGLVQYRQVVRDPEGTEQIWQVNLEYRVARGELRINLCPPLALCLAATELVGPASRDELVLTHYFAQEPREVYRFIADLPD